MKMDLAVARYEIAKISIFIENIKIIISGKNGDDGTELIINEGNGYRFFIFQKYGGHGPWFTAINNGKSKYGNFQSRVLLLKTNFAVERLDTRRCKIFDSGTEWTVNKNETVQVVQRANFTQKI